MEVLVQLLVSKCISVLTYGLPSLPLNQVTTLLFLDFS